MKKLVVIDNFYKDPDIVRNFALTKAEYVAQGDLPYGFTGTESKSSYYSGSTVARVEEAIGEKIIVNTKQYSFGVFCKTYEKDNENRAVHIDQSDWTGLIYLNRPQECQGGTCFYHHLETGLDCVPSQVRLAEMGYTNRQEFVEKFVTPEGKKHNKWKVHARVGMKYNRMVLFRASELFHASEEYFGNSDETCRLTQLFFFKIGGVL